MVPNAMVVAFVARHGLDVGLYLHDAVRVMPSTQLLLDLVIAATAFICWAVWDARRSGVRRWWVIFPATFLVGLCFALPLYLHMRERATEPAGARG